MNTTAIRHEGIAAFTLAAVLALAGAPAFAAGSHGHAAGSHGGKGGQGSMGEHGAAHAAGMAGKPGDVSRTIEITMFDNYYEPEAVTVNDGETVRFVVKNAGQLVHEFNLGSPDMHVAHQEEMAMMVQHGVLHPDHIDHDRMMMDMGGGHTMKHDDPNSVLLEPGKSGEVVWKFSKARGLEFACNVPGHYDAGMVGGIKVN